MKNLDENSRLIDYNVKVKPGKLDPFLTVLQNVGQIAWFYVSKEARGVEWFTLTACRWLEKPGEV